MKKRLSIYCFTTIFLVSTLFSSLISCKTIASDISSEQGNPNQYVVTKSLQDYAGTSELWIGTLRKWKATGGSVGDTGTFFVNGEAIHNDDIIIHNGKVGIVLAVGTRNPWGYPAGSILDAGIVNGNKGGRDTIWSAEVLVNGWDSWSPSNCGVVTFDVVKYDFDTKKEGENGLSAVKVSRVYNVGETSFDVVTYYSIAKDATYAYMFDEMTNTSGKTTESLSQRFALTNKGDDGGAMFGGDVASNKAYGGVVASYGKTDKNTFFTSLIMPGNVKRINAKTGAELNGIVEPSRVGGSVGYKCVRVDSKGNFSTGDKFNTYEVDEKRTYNSYLVISDKSNSNETINLISKLRGDDTIEVAGNTIPESTVIIENNGSAIGWFESDNEGNFSFKLPKGLSYTAYVEAKGKVSGKPITIPASGATNIKLEVGPNKEKVTLNIKDKDGNPLYAKVEVLDAYPNVRYNGESIYLSREQGKVEIEASPTSNIAVVYAEGYWFYSKPVELNINPAKATSYDVVVDMVYDLPKGWYAGDLHHHANKNDAFSKVDDAILSMKASGLDIGYITDHDFTVNNFKAYKEALKYKMTGYIPSEEITCSWAHFNVLPLVDKGYKFFLDEKEANHVINQFEQLPIFAKQVRDTGSAMTANHPWYSYGLFYAEDKNAVPGGYSDNYNNIEINACSSDEENFKTITTTMELWNSYLDGTTSSLKNSSGNEVKTDIAHYILGGSDTHDVLYPGFAGNDYTNNRSSGQYTSGKVRTIAYIDNIGNDIKSNGLAYSKAVVEGKSYTTFGPLLTFKDNIIPASYNKVSSDGSFTLNVKIESLNNIQDVIVLSEYGKSDYKGIRSDDKYNIKNINAKEKDISIKYSLEENDESSWFSIMVFDDKGNYAITNPFWINK